MRLLKWAWSRVFPTPNRYRRWDGATLIAVRWWWWRPLGIGRGWAFGERETRYTMVREDLEHLRAALS